ncbi:gtp binding protein [Diaporthe amygdali]|uniref:gtp binding protein n=1 Tax=Phomopsis amygdali TaxID=1214568 RepID=UPI0022FE2892|nr:gtp binding protein [Diaporthe amygdali]KAJ0106808.1 gtp binding protein [Diaporthe amygdali]
MTPEEIEELFKRTDGVVVVQDAGGDEDDDEPTLTEDETSYRVARLKDVLLEAQSAWDGGSEVLDRIAEKLGDGSRRYENRARVVEDGHINAIIDLLQHDSLLPYVVTVLYNVLVDYEPVQLQACEAGLSQRLTDLLSGPRLETSRPLIGLICKILALLIAQEPEVRTGSPTTPQVLLNIATSQEHPVDLEDFSALTSVALAYLTHETFQTSNLASVPLLLEAFSMSHTSFDPSDAADPDAAAQLKQVRSAFVPVLADISALPGFIPVPTPDNAQAPPLLQHPVFQTLQGWLRSSAEHATLQSAACLALGNVARSDATCETLVGSGAIHEPLIDLLTRCTGSGTTTTTTASPPNAQLTHAVLSFLKNLAIPAANKPALGRLLEPGLLPKLWSTWGDAQPQSQFAAVSLGRLLLVGCAANAARLVAPLGRDAEPSGPVQTNLHVLLSLFQRSDAEPTKTEVARAVANVCRTLHSAPVESVLSEEWEEPPPSSADDQGGNTPATTTTSTQDPTTSETRRAHFYAAHPAVPTTLSLLLTQTRFPALRSEAWFVLALTSRSVSGARVARAVLEPAGACRALVEAVTGRRDVSDGDDLLLAAGSPASGRDDAVEDVLSNSTGGAAGAEPNQAGGAVGGVSLGMEGLGLGDLQPQQVDPAARAGMTRIDRENGLCLVAELVRNCAGELDPARRAIYERLLVTGGELVLNSRGEVASG